jgi:hypothetical protein
MADTTPEKLAREQAELERRGVERVRARNANVLDRLATAIKQASNLWELHHALCDFEKEYEDIHGRDNMEGALNDCGIDLCELPTFGGDWPKNTDGVWSWDAEHILAGEGPFRDWEIRERVNKLAREQAELERRTAERKAIRDANMASGLVPPGPGEDVS